MPTPRAGYYLRDGTKVPSVTTVLGRWKESGGLLQWAFQQGQSGAPTLYTERDKAAEIGTMAHDMVDAHIHNREYERPAGAPTADVDKARQAFDAYLEWEQDTGIVIEATEMQLVSEKHRFGGTPDAIGIRLRNGTRCLLDWKTSNGIYRDYLIQVAGYKILWEENYPDRVIDGGYFICRFSKSAPDFEVRYFRELDLAVEMFINMRALYEQDLRLKERCR